MSDPLFVIAAYLVVIGSLLGYAMSLVRRERVAASVTQEIERTLDQP